MKEYVRMAVSLAMLVAGIVMTANGTGWFGNGTVQALWYAVAFLPVGIGVIREAWECFLEKEYFSEFTLMTVASIGAFAIGEYPEGVAVMLFYCIGEMLQDKAVDRARDNIRSLMDFRPDKAVVVGDGGTTVKSPDDVRVGDIIEVKPGERVPLDGELLTEGMEFNTAALTGESVPKLIAKGKEVMAGMIATDGVARLRVLRPAGESAVARILKMVEEAGERKAPAELFIRRFARKYTPTVIALAALTVLLPWLLSLAMPAFDYVFADWFYRALIFLVISCPCALVVSIPLSYFAGIGAASVRGILFKGGNMLEAAAHLDAVAFDKTGTLTNGEFAVVRTEGNDARMLAVVAAMERNSSHPIARAIVEHAGNDGMAEVSDVKNIPGYGMTALCGGERWMAGTLRLLDRERIAYPKELADVPETIVAVARDDRFAGYILLADTLKADAREAVEGLRRCGIRDISILSGDKQALVDKVAASLGVDGYGDLLPQDKVARLEAMKRGGRSVAFVGDGINDAPVLALSDVGMAMGGLGADMAIETADVVIRNDNPAKIAQAVTIGRRTVGIVHQNIVFAIGAKVLIMLLGLAGFANLWAAVFADVGVALLAVLNAMRIYVRKTP